MSPRATVILLLLALLLGGFIYLYELRDEAEDTPSESDEEVVFAGIESAQVDWIRLRTRDGHEVEAERGDAGWELIMPIRFPADQVAFDGMASQLAQLEIAGRVSGSAPLSDFGLAEEGERVQFRAAGAEHVLRIGRSTPVGANIYVAPLGDDAVLYVAAWRVNTLRKKLVDLRDRRVVDFDRAALDGLRVAWPGMQVELERRDDEWWLLAPVEGRADQETVDTLISDLAFLRADDFVDERAPLAELGLDPPAFHVVLQGGSSGDDEADAGEQRVWHRGLMLSEAREGSSIAQGRGGALFRVAGERLDDFPRELTAYRDREIARFAVADARAFDLAFAVDGAETRTVRGTLVEGEWETEPETVAGKRVRALVQALSRLEAAEIVAEALGPGELAAFGLAPPRLGVRVLGEGGSILADVRLGPGEAEPERGRLAMRADAPVVYRLSPFDAEVLPDGWAEFVAPAGEGEEGEGGAAAERAEPFDGTPGTAGAEEAGASPRPPDPELDDEAPGV